MSYQVLTLRRAEADIRSIVGWLAKRSIAGANAWLGAYDRIVVQLRHQANSFGSAVEAAAAELPLKQAFFKTRHGRTYRAIFLIVGDQVRILRVRGPGQAPVEPEELI